MDYVTFAVIMLLGQFSPGPDMVLLMRNALGHSRRAGLWTVLGIAVGLAVHTGVALAGLAVAIRNSPASHAALLVAGGLWLLWLGGRLLADGLRNGSPNPAETARRRRPLADRAAFLQGLVTNLTNAKAVLFLAGVLVAALGPDPGFARKAAFFGIVVCQALVFWSLFVCVLQRPGIQRLYYRAEKWINIAFGTGLAALAVSALLEGAGRLTG